MKTIAIIQARISSTRLPGKVLADIGGKPMLWYVVRRAQAAKRLDQVVVATSNEASDDQIAEFCAATPVECYRGSEGDVLDRYHQAAQRFNADVIVRLTADCPLLDPEVIDKVVAGFYQGQFAYVSNTVRRTYPDGLDTEVFSREALERAWREAGLLSEREHVTPYIWKHPGLFRLGGVLNREDFSALRWTVDEPPDLEFVRAVYGHLGETSFGMNQVLRLLKDYPELAGINAGFVQNEGYQISLRQDRLSGVSGGR